MAHAQVAGTTLLGVRYDELRDVTLGWSTKRQIISQPVFNSQDDRVGFVDDLIVAGDRAVTYAIVNVGGFVGLAKHDVLFRSRFKLMDGKSIQDGTTKEALKASPPFEYANDSLAITTVSVGRPGSGNRHQIPTGEDNSVAISGISNSSQRKGETKCLMPNPV